MRTIPEFRRTTGHAREIIRWTFAMIPEESRGQIVSLEELGGIFPQTSRYREIELSQKHDHYNVYAKPNEKGGKAVVAYECKACDNIVVGPPRIESNYSEKSEGARRIYCTNCDHNLETGILDS